MTSAKQGEVWAAIEAKSTHVTVVRATVSEATRLTIDDDTTFKVQDGDRTAAYRLLHQRTRDYLKDHNVAHVIVKAGAVPVVKGRAAPASKALLESSEVRGVVLAAAALAVPDARQRAKATTSRTFGSRNVDGYTGDDSFWVKATSGSLRKGSREIALLLLAEVRGDSDD